LTFRGCCTILFIRIVQLFVRRYKVSETHVSIGRVKRDISELVNRVAYGGERIVLTSRGKPKAALVSISDYDRLAGQDATRKRARWQAWQQEVRELGAAILQRRQGKPVDVDALWDEVREEREARDDRILGR
jgi:prevent-host-death family protein